jgi:hypothetical protein
MDEFKSLKEEVERYRNLNFLIDKNLTRFEEFGVKKNGRLSRRYLNEMRKQVQKLRRIILIMLKEMRGIK